ncbi:MAG: Hsp33 family molecular chaperone HslO [Chloroflexota bacterium]
MIKSIARDEPVLVVAVVDTGAVERARLIHDTFPTATSALGRTLTGAVLLSSLLKEGQKLSLQVVGEGPLKEVFAEADWRGRVRGYARRPHVFLGLLGGNLDVGRGFGNGYLHVVKDLGVREPYHSSIPLQTGEIASDIAYYLSVSEQIPAAVSVGVYVGADNSVMASGGFMVHALPEAGEELIGDLENRIGDLKPVSSMVLDGMDPEEITAELLAMPYEVLERRDIIYSCPCSRDRVMRALIALGKDDIRELAAKGEPLSIECHFCKAGYTVTQEELEDLLREVTGS